MNIRRKKRYIRLVIGLLTAPLLVFVSLLVLLYLPPVQNWAVGKAMHYASEATGMDIRVGRVALAFPLDLKVEEVAVLDSVGDTLARVGRLRVGVAVRPLLHGEVKVRALELARLKADTRGWFPSIAIAGEVESLRVEAGEVDLAAERIAVGNLQLDGADVGVVLLPDTTPEDTASAPAKWAIGLQQVSLRQTDFRLQIPADTLDLSVGWTLFETQDVEADLGRATYGVEHFLLKGGHVALGGDKAFSPLYGEGGARMDSVGITLPGLRMETLSSRLQANGRLPWNALLPMGEERLSVTVEGELGRGDILAWAGGAFPRSLVEAWPKVPLTFRTNIEGNMQELWLAGLQAGMDSVVTLKARGHVAQVTEPTKRRGEGWLELQGHDLDFLTLWADTTHSGNFSIPRGIGLDGTFSLQGNNYEATLTLKEQRGILTASGHYDTRTEEYALQVRTDSLALHHFLPKDSLYCFTAHADIRGKGTDPYSAQTRMQGEVVIDTLQYGGWSLSDISLKAGLEAHRAEVTVDSHNPLLEMQTKVDALLRRDSLKAKADVEVSRADLHALRLSDGPLTTSISLDVEGETNRRDSYAAQGGFTGFTLHTGQGTFKPKDLRFSAFTRRDSTFTRLSAGDLKLQLAGQGEAASLVSRLQEFVAEAVKGLENRKLRPEELKEYLPDLKLQLRAGEDNPVSNYLHYVSGYRMDSLDLQLALSPASGIHGQGYVGRFCTDSLQLDTIRFSLSQDTLGMVFRTEVCNAPENKAAFAGQLHGKVGRDQGEVTTRLFNNRNEKGLELGVRAMLEPDGVRLSLIPEQPTLAYRPFHLNEGNYLALRDSGRVEADISLLDKGGTGLRLYTLPGEESLQDITLDIARLRLDEVVEIFPYLPQMGGVMDAALHYVRKPDASTFSGTIGLENLMYEGTPMGTFGVEAVYLPTEEGSHLADLQLMRNDREILSAGLSLTLPDREETKNAKASVSSSSGRVEGALRLTKFPLEMANAFLPRELVSLKGTANGQLDVSGHPDKLGLGGTLSFDSARVESPLYALQFKLAPDPVKIADGRMTFEDFKVYAQGKNPFVLNGNINFSDPAQMTADLRMRAVEYELLNARQSKDALLYGKVFVSLFSTIRGPLDALQVRGDMNVLGKSDFTYVLKDSPLSVDDRLGSMVTFVNFADTTDVPELHPQVTLGGLDMVMNVQIDEGAQMRVDLSDDNYVKLQGGGNLSLQYSPQEDLTLTGRYTLTSGEMKYSLPVIPLKTFRIGNGSYVEFTGDPANPILNIKATERVRTTVTEDKASRYVNFDVGVAITNTLDQMGLEFTLSAPEDVSLQNQLATMSAEERGKLAVTMLVTGMYMGGDGTTGGFSTNNALNSFLQSEISNIAGSALKTVDISIGMEDNYASDGTSGGGTDYSFRFAKRFWNNRLSVVIGGRISTGNETNAAEAGEGNSFIDDVSLEWRLDDSGTRYVRLFHNKNYESILEGEITETGVGLVLRRKVNKLGELFIFRRQKTLGMKELKVKN